MTIKPTPNALGVNFLDTAVLDPYYCLDLMNRFDMAQATIFDGAHPKEAFNTAVYLREKRPQSVIFYRRWRANLPDERLPLQTRPDEWVNYFKDALDAGLTPAANNESITNPLTPVINYSTGILDLIGSNLNYSSVHFKVPFGNPGGYNGESLLPPSDPRYRPDGYAEADTLWKRAAQINKPRIDAGLFPGVWIAPHSYFPTTGSASGMSDRHKEIYRRADFLGIDRHYLPLAAGESGIIKTNPLDADAGFDGLIDGAAYADVFSLVLFKDYLPYNLIPHLFAVGRSEGGRYAKFDLMNTKTFWDRLEKILASGAYRLPYWYGADYVNLSNAPQRPANMGEGVKINVVTSASYLNLRTRPALAGLDVGNVLPGESVVIFPATKTTEGSYTWHYISRDNPTPGEPREGWINYPSQLIPAPPIVVTPPPDEQPPKSLDISFTFKFSGVPMADVSRLENLVGDLYEFIKAGAKVDLIVKEFTGGQP